MKLKPKTCSYILSRFIQRKTHTLPCSPFLQIQNVHARSLSLYVGCSYLEPDTLLDAHKVFDEVSELNVVSATTIISRFSRQHRHDVVIYLFSRMLMLNIRPTEFTFGTVIHSGTALRSLNVGRQLQACATKMGLNFNVFVGSAVLDFYVKLSTIEEAERAFGDISEPNVVCYTSLVLGYLKKDRSGDALSLFRKMPERNVVSWNAMIAGYAQTGCTEEAVNLFIEMLRDGSVPNQSTFPCAITAAANIASLGMGRSFHACAVKCLGKLDVFVGNSLVSLYAKCGSMEDSLLAFTKLERRTIVSWNALICGYAQNGRGEEAIDLYERMYVEGIRPNSVTLLGLLWACNHAGLVQEGSNYFNQAKLREPNLLKPEHYACMVDLLSRSGQFKEAEQFLHKLPFDPGTGFWKALLGGCQIHSNIELGKFAAGKILASTPEDVSSYIMLSNAHSAAGQWQGMSAIRREMKEKGMKRVPGCSWIEIRSRIHVFVTGDRNHQQKDEINMVLMFFKDNSKDIEASSFLIES